MKVACQIRLRMSTLIIVLLTVAFCSRSCDCTFFWIGPSPAQSPISGDPPSGWRPPSLVPGVVFPQSTSPIGENSKEPHRKSHDLLRLPQILCSYAASGRWPSFPAYLQPAIVDLGRHVFALDDPGVRQYCAKFTQIPFVRRPCCAYPVYPIFITPGDRTTTDSSVDIDVVTGITSDPDKADEMPETESEDKGDNNNKDEDGNDEEQKPPNEDDGEVEAENEQGEEEEEDEEEEEEEEEAENEENSEEEEDSDNNAGNEEIAGNEDEGEKDLEAGEAEGEGDKGENSVETAEGDVEEEEEEEEEEQQNGEEESDQGGSEVDEAGEEQNAAEPVVEEIVESSRLVSDKTTKYGTGLSTKAPSIHAQVHRRSGSRRPLNIPTSTISFTPLYPSTAPTLSSFTVSNRLNFKSKRIHERIVKAKGFIEGKHYTTVSMVPATASSPAHHTLSKFITNKNTSKLDRTKRFKIINATLASQPTQISSKKLKRVKCHAL